MKKVDKISSFLFMLVLLQACDKEAVSPNGQTKVSGTIETFAGMGPTSSGFAGDGGTATSARLSYVTGVTVDGSNNVYISDGASNVIRKVNSSDGIISTIAGTFLGFNVIDPTPYAGDGGPATQAHFNTPWSISVDDSNNLYVVDIANMVVRQISANGIVSTVAGKGPTLGYEGDGSLATLATFDNLYNVASDDVGNLYIVDSQNHAIRMVTKSTGKISTIAGQGPDHAGYTGDNGPATAATLNAPLAIAVDASGTVYIGDNLNNVIRKISNGMISTYAGTGETGYSGDGGLATKATFSAIRGLATDAEGNLYISDSGNSVIRKVTLSTGKISTIAGTGVAGYEGDGGPALAAKIFDPLGIAVDSDGNVYFADSQNSAIRVIWK